MPNRFGLMGVKPRVYVPENPDAYLTFDWTRDRYRLNGVSSRLFNSSSISGLSVSRTHTGFTNAYVYNTLTGLYEPVAAGVARIGAGTGLLVEEARSFLTPKARRLDDTLVWTHSNITTSAVVGVDGVAASATRLIAGAANATALGATNTIASSARRLAPFIRRVAGTGNIDLTLDGGSTWTTLSGVTSSWQRLGVGQTVANPRVGIRLATAGDEIDIDFANGESGSFDTSPVETTSAGASATRAADNISVGGLSIPQSLTMFAEFVTDSVHPSVFRRILNLRDDADVDRVAMAIGAGGQVTRVSNQSGSAAAGSNFTLGAITRVAGMFNATEARGSQNGGAIFSGAWPSSADLTIAQLGAYNGSSNVNGYLRRAVLYPRAFSDSELIAATQ